MNSICRLSNWNLECEKAINKQISLEYWASLQYHVMASYFDKDNVALDNISKYYSKSSLEEREHADKFIKYQNKRGGNVIINDIIIDNNFINTNSNKSDILQSFEKALEMEQKVYKSLLDLHKISEEANDPQFSDFIETNYLEEQIDSINDIAKYIAQLKRIGNYGHGIWNFNNEFRLN